MAGTLLCPVRAVKRYRDRTSQLRLRCERLFVTSGRTKKENSKNTFSFWLCKVISLAYQLSGKPLPSPSPLTRETHGIAPSLLFKKNYAISQVLKAGTWQRHTTFTRHYLRDLVTQVTGYLPPGSSGGGTGHGITGPVAPEYPNSVTSKHL